MGNEVTKKDLDAVYKHIATIAGSCNDTARSATDALRKQIEANATVGDKNTGTYRDAIQKLDNRAGRLEEETKWLNGMVKWLEETVEALQKKRASS